MRAQGLFVGTLRHRRLSPVPHAFSYPTLMAWIDIDRVAELLLESRLVSQRWWHVASFDPREHLRDLTGTLRERLVADAAREGIEVGQGPIRLLTHLRHFGYRFNPLSLFYVFEPTGQVRCVLAEVHNTFGGSHRYWLQPDGTAATFRASADKRLYVSPFMPVDVSYRFTLTPPAERLAAHIAVTREHAVVFDASLALDWTPWSASNIRRQLLRYPFMTARVIAAIHWQAVRLWWKGVPLVPRRTADGVNEHAAWAIPATRLAPPGMVSVTSTGMGQTEGATKR